MNIQQAIDWAKSELQNSDNPSDSPKLDAECLLTEVLNKNRSYLYTWPEKTLEASQQNQFEQLVNQRLAGHPIAHLLGYKEFWGLDLQVTPDTLIPRPDTEILVEKALDIIQVIQTNKNHSKTPPPPLQIIDLGTGSGAIACAIKSECPSCEVVATDFSKNALQIAKQNATTHNLDIEFYQGSWLEAVPEKQSFDLILSNPPYIEDNDPHLQQGDVRFDPITALTSGSDGLDDIRQIASQTKRYLKTDGWVIIEHGYNQAQAVQQILHDNQFQAVASQQDYGGQPRITFGQKS